MSIEFVIANEHFFVNVEDRPLLPKGKAIVIAAVGVLSLALGALVHLKIFSMLKNKRKNKNTDAIDTLFFVHHLVSCVFHPPLFIYFIVKNFYYPLSDLLGKVGCGILLVYMDVFVRWDLFFHSKCKWLIWCYEKSSNLNSSNEQAAVFEIKNSLVFSELSDTDPDHDIDPDTNPDDDPSTAPSPTPDPDADPYTNDNADRFGFGLVFGYRFWFVLGLDQGWCWVWVWVWAWVGFGDRLGLGMFLPHLSQPITNQPIRHLLLA